MDIPIQSINCGNYILLLNLSTTITKIFSTSVKETINTSSCTSNLFKIIYIYIYILF